MRSRVGQPFPGRISQPMRAFVAIPILPPALEIFHAVRARLIAQIPGVRWAPATSPHITLHFFGTIGDLELARAVVALRPVLTTQQPMSLQLRGLGSFPSDADARVLWFGVAGQRAQLAACALSCRSALSAAGFAVESRPYRAHCTLGRPRRGWPAVARERWQRIAAADPSSPAFLADRAILYESVPTADGVRHVALEVMGLCGRDAPASAVSDSPGG